MIDPLLNNRGVKTSNINDFLIHIGKIAKQDAIEQSGVDAFNKNASTMQALVNQANISDIKVQFADVLDQGQLGKEVYGSRLSKSLIISSISDSTLKEFDLPENSSSRGYHVNFDIGSEKHNAVLRALKKEKIPRSVLKRATTADQFIMLNPIEVFSGTDQLSLLSNAKTVFHEIGHGFSDFGGYDSNLDLNRLVNMAKILRSKVGTDGYQNALNKFGQSHIQYMKMRAIEEARAESFAHSMIARLGKGIELGRAAAEDAAEESDVMYRSVSYTNPHSWKWYDQESFDILRKYLEIDTLKTPQMQSFGKRLILLGRTEAEKTFFTGIDSSILTQFENAVPDHIDLNSRFIRLDFSSEASDEYVHKMNQLLDGSLGRKVGESGIVQIQERQAYRGNEMAAHATMGVNKRSASSSAASLSAKIDSKPTQQIAEQIADRSVKKRVLDFDGLQSVSRSAKKTSSKIISGIETAMDMIRVVK